MISNERQWSARAEPILLAARSPAPSALSRRRDGLVPPDDATREVVAEYLQRFAERAWRRQVKQEELADYLHAYRAEREAGEKTAAAIHS